MFYLKSVMRNGFVRHVLHWKRKNVRVYGKRREAEMWRPEDLRRILARSYPEKYEVRD